MVKTTRNTSLYLLHVPVNLVSGRIGSMVIFFIPNDTPSELICLHQFEWNAPFNTDWHN